MSDVDAHGGLPAQVARGAGVLVVVPTYQERLNVEDVVAAAARGRARWRTCWSSTTTARTAPATLADELAAADPQVHVLHRAAKEGLGAAYLAGFGWGLERGYDVLVEMDADGSHQPEQLPALLAALPDADLVLGSRWVPGGSVVNWPARRAAALPGRQHATSGGRCGLGLRDATGGFRAFRRTTLEKLDLDGVASQGYCFQVDLAWRDRAAGFRVVEVPIEFVERVRGESKMSGAIVREALWRVTVWGAAAAGRPAARPAPPTGGGERDGRGCSSWRSWSSRSSRST